MNGVKILHIADFHIGRKFKSLNPRKASSRSMEVLSSFEKILLRFSDAQIVLMSGDIFEEDAPSEDIGFVCSLLAKNKDMRFFVSCGNHDSFDSPAMEQFMRKAPENVHVFSTAIEKITLDDLKVNVYGISLGAPTVYSSLLSGFKAQEGDYVNIMTMHGDINPSSSYNPISVSEIKESGLDYLALGHVHSFSGIENTDSVFYAYPGVPEPGGFDECDDCGVIYGSVFKNRTELEFYPVSLRKYCHLSLDITDFSSNRDVATHLDHLMDKNNFYKIYFEGAPQNFIPDISFFEDVTDAYYVEFINNCKNIDSILNYMDEKSLRGKTAQIFDSMKNDYPEEIYLEAKDILTNLMCKD